MSKPYPEYLKQLAHELYIPGVVGPKRISKQLGVSKSTVYRWLHPEYEQRHRQEARQRKLRYRGSCLDCGAPTTYVGKNGKRAATRCLDCNRAYQHANRKWNRDNVVAAIKRWHQEHGRRPSASDWVRAGDYYPPVTSIYQGPNPIFSSWADALRAAGYDKIQFAPGPGRQMFDRREAQRLRLQMTDKEIAEHYGVSPTAIHAALGPRVVTVKPKAKPRAGNAAERRAARIEALNRALAKQTPSD